MGTQPLTDIQAFFAARAGTWEARFPDDGPAYTRAVLDLGPPAGGTALDLGAGTGRALEPLRRAVGPRGRVIALDATWEMLATGREAGRDAHADLVLADAGRLPLLAGSVDAAFAAGILHHLPGPDHGLGEAARVVHPGGRLAIFHPIGRAALAARRGQRLTDEDLLAEGNLARTLVRFGWDVQSVEDGDDRYLALAVRR